jgi:hypothetical protein
MTLPDRFAVDLFAAAWVARPRTIRVTLLEDPPGESKVQQVPALPLSLTKFGSLFRVWAEPVTHQCAWASRRSGSLARVARARRSARSDQEMIPNKRCWESTTRSRRTPSSLNFSMT